MNLEVPGHSRSCLSCASARHLSEAQSHHVTVTKDLVLTPEDDAQLPLILKPRHQLELAYSPDYLEAMELERDKALAAT